MSLAGAVALSGCAGDFTTDVTPTSAISELGTIQGNNYGGHSPVVGSKIFVLEATTTGYGEKEKSLLQPSSSNNEAYPLMLDSSGGVTDGLYYVN